MDRMARSSAGERRDRRFSLPALARRPARDREVRPGADRPWGLVRELGAGSAPGASGSARSVRLLQQSLGRPLARERRRDEAAVGPRARRAEVALAAGGAVVSGPRGAGVEPRSTVPRPSAPPCP